LKRSLPLFVLWFALAGVVSHLAGQTTHRLTPTPETVQCGFFDASVPPAVTVRSGDILEVETLPAVGSVTLEAGGLPPVEVPAALRELEREVKRPRVDTHILAGPVFVEGAEPGDVLEVRVLSVRVALPYAVNFWGPGGGFLYDEFPYARSVRVPLDLDRNVAKFAEGIEIPLKPFFGVMGVAPPLQTGRIGSGPPWVHGGNMDNQELGEGATVYIPVHAKGALFSVGDGHAAQGDGELCGTALETGLHGKLQLIVRKDLSLRWPRAETATHYVTMGFHENLEQAARIATLEMLDYLVEEKGLSRDRAYILASDAVDLRITQLVDGKKGVHAMLPKALFVK
jgi:acetamidase/formamidase